MNRLDGASVNKNLGKYEAYINEVLDRVTPEELKGDSMIHAYLRNQASYNASMTPSGLTFINLGLFGHAKDESTLAGVLAHELAHYVQKHSFKGFLKSQHGDFKTSIFYKNQEGSRFSIGNELESDELAMKWMSDAGYDLKGLEDGFQIMQNTENNIIDRMRYKWELKETTHPLSGKRLEKIKEYIDKNDTEGGASEFISQDTFNELRELAKPIILDDLLTNYSYDNCIELAFKFHIEDPSNSTYMLYLMESIRRKCYLDPDEWSSLFVTSRFYRDSILPTEEVIKIKRTDHLFTSFPNQILNISDEDASSLPGKFYWGGDPKFTTNEEAFTYFYLLGKRMKNSECLLSNALSYSASPELMNQFLDEYLLKENIQYRSYATALRNDEIYSSLKKKKLLVYSDFTTVVRQGKQDIRIREELSPIKRQLDTLYDLTIDGDDTRELLILEDLKDTDMEAYKLFQELEILSFYSFISKNKTYIHLLDPRYYQVFLDYNVDEIEFVNSIFLEARKKSNDVETYKEALKVTPIDLLYQMKSTRYFEVFVTSVRLKEEAAMKIRHYGGETTLNFKRPGYEQVLNIMKACLKDKDELAIERDREFKKLTSQ